MKVKKKFHKYYNKVISRLLLHIDYISI